MLVPMRRHAGAVILLGGWVLMLPPVEQASVGDLREPQELLFRGWRAQSGVPVATWKQEAAFDTAKECEAARASLGKKRTEVFLKAMPPTESTDPGGKEPAGGFGDLMASQAAQARDSRCVPAESVYPPQPTAPK